MEKQVVLEELCVVYCDECEAGMAMDEAGKMGRA